MDSPLDVTQFVKCFGLGGTERQFVQHLRGLRGNWRTEVLCTQATGELLETVRSLGYEPEEFRLGRSLVHPQSGVQAARIARRLRASGTRLLHSHDFYTNMLGSAAARLAGIPYIISRRDLGAWIGPWRAAALRVATKSATKVLCNATAIRDLLVNREGIDPDRVAVIHNGLDLVAFDAAVARGTAPGLRSFEGAHPVVVCVGNLKHGVKGHASLLIAAAEMIRAVPEARLLLAGEGELQPALEAQARELGIASSVEFAGARTDVPALLSRATVAVCPSLSEGLSNAVMEAMAAGLPVVATSVGGNAELVEEGASGFLVPPSAPTALASRLIDLLRQPEVARRSGQRGRQRMASMFSVDRLHRATSELYAEILQLPANRAAA